MAPSQRKFSTRLVRKGALIQETYTAFREWDLSLSIRDNLQVIRNENLIGAKNQGWLHEIVTTLSSRFHTSQEVEPLVVLARGGMPIDCWKACLLWHVGNVDELYYRFAVDWLFERFKEGVLLMQTGDVLPFVRAISDGRVASGGHLSDYGALRTARDLFRMAHDFGLVEGAVKKKFANYNIPQEAFMFVLHALAAQGKNASKMLAAKCWRLFLMAPDDVERELLRLHQYNLLEYQVAGSITHLKLPCTSPTDYARKLLA